MRWMNARRFYQHFGFQTLTDDQLHLYLPMADAASLVRKIFDLDDDGDPWATRQFSRMEVRRRMKQWT